jgi:uncharacterized delta-60 repeat protein
MKMLGRSWGAAIACFLVGLVWAVGMAKGDSVAVQPDGRIVVIGHTFPEFGALARLNADGSVDQSFGAGGFVVDTRLPSFASVALQAGDRVLVGAVGGFQLARYDLDGSVDSAFGQDGIGGTPEADQPHFGSTDFGPTSLLVRPDGSIVAGGNRSALLAGDAEAFVRRYDATGNSVETVGHVPRLSGAADLSLLRDLIEGDDGGLYGVGSTYEVSASRVQPFLVRFVPGSGEDFDPGFAGGKGLARVDLPPSERFPSSFAAVARQGERLVAAGRHGGTFLLARFDADGKVDSSFGKDGYVLPEIVGTGNAPEGRPSHYAESWANDVAVSGDGIVAVGGTSQWGLWKATKNGIYCENCPEPMLARLDADGNLDPDFGSGGLLRLPRPDGSAFSGAEARAVLALGDGKLLVQGSVQLAGGVQVPFVARLNADGSYDTSFGSSGLTVLDFPCTVESEAEKRTLGCVPHVRTKLRLSGMRRGRPAVLLRAKPSQGWAGIYSLSLTLPRGMHLRKGFRSKLRVVAVGSSEAGRMELERIRPSRSDRRVTLIFRRFGIASEVKVRLPRASLSVNRHLRTLRPHRKVAFGIRADFTHLGWGGYGGYDVAVRRAG